MIHDTYTLYIIHDTLYIIHYTLNYTLNYTLYIIHIYIYRYCGSPNEAPLSRAQERLRLLSSRTTSIEGFGLLGFGVYKGLGFRGFKGLGFGGFNGLGFTGLRVKGLRV